MASFALIRDHDVRGVELDVHRCATGEIVVTHDNTLARTAGVPVPVIGAPFAELREYDVGSWFASSFGNERIPLLEEVFELLAGYCFFDIEIKHYRSYARRALEGTVEAETVRLIRRHGLVRQCIVSSFDPLVVRRVRLLAPEVPVAAIYSSGRDTPFLLRRSGARYLSGSTVMKPHHASATVSHVNRHHRRGRLIMPWTVDDPEVACELAARGVDAIITNRPGEIRETLETREGTGSGVEPAT